MIKKDHKFFRKNKLFTLIELIVVMALFVVIFAIVTRFYDSVHKVVSASGEHSMIFENAKIAMDLMTREIQCIYYENGQTPFWHHGSSTSWNEYSNELLAFVSATSFLPNTDCTTNLCEIKYQLYYTTTSTDQLAGWLRRSVTGNKSSGNDNAKWNYYDNLTVGYTTTSVSDTPVAAFTANSVSSDNYQKVIPYVTDLTFNCFDKYGETIDPDDETSQDPDACTITGFPFSIEINLSIMNKNSWQKWIDIGGTPENLSTDPKSDFRKKHERSFKKTVLIGNRGQY